MTKVHKPQTNFTAGVLDPELAAREDITFYYNALKDGDNVLIDPRGGVGRRPGKQRIRRLTNVMTAIDISGATLTVPEGGTAANVRDGDVATLVTTTNDVGATNPFVIVTVDLLTAQAVAAIDIVDYKLSALSLAGEFVVQYSLNNIAWSNFGTVFDWDSESRSRRAKPDAGAVTARYWRVARIGVTATAAKASIAELKFWAESAELSTVRLIPFSYSTQQAYMLVATDQNIDVMAGTEFQSGIYIPHRASQVGVMNYTQSLDALLLFHGNVQPFKIFRQGGDDEFDFRSIVFENIPRYDYGVAPDPASLGVNEVQTITGTAVNGDKFYLTLQGKKTAVINGNATQATVATNIQTALRNLSNTSATGITVARVGSTYVVTFAGDDGKRPWEQMDIDVSLMASPATIARTTPGQYVGASENNETQVINISAALVATARFTLLLEGERTAVIHGDATASVVATNIQTALEALENVGAGNVLVTVVTDGYQVIFTGDAGNRPWLALEITILAGTQVCDVSRTLKGRYPGEDIMSNTRGWPRCGTFYQERLYMGGMPLAPNVVIGSVVSEFYNLDIDRDDPTAALMFRADTDQVSSIYQIVPGRHLSFFCNDAEFYIPNEPITKDAIMKLTTACGSKEGLRVFNGDGALMFLQGVRDETEEIETATSVREFIYDFAEQAYQANMLSKLSSHLVRDPVGTALRKGVKTGEADVLLMANRDGTGTAYTVLRSDAVNAFSPISLRAGDKLLDVGVDKRRRVYWATERVIAGTTKRFLEMWNDDLYLDCGDIIRVEAEEFIATAGQTVFTWTFDSPALAAAIGVRINQGRQVAADFTVNLGAKTVTLDTGAAAGDVVRIASMIIAVTGIDDLEGETVETFIDGSPGDAVEITGGTLTLSAYADTEVQYGFEFAVEGELMPFRLPDTNSLCGLLTRCAGATLTLSNTINLEIQANDGEWQELELNRFDTEIFDRSAVELAFTGEHRIDGLLGHAVGAPFKFRQSAPGPFKLLGITREVTL
ncbi:MAG: hypothetical protein PSY14_06720 [bacterium]|nr:hypothetical protein [bacterium]